MLDTPDGPVHKQPSLEVDVTYYNSTLFPPSVQYSSLQISDLKLLQRRDPISFGEKLCELKSQGLNHTQISAQLSLNRHMVGRYLRIGSWDAKLKAAIKAQGVSNTALLKAASKALSLGELRALFMSSIKSQSVVEREQVTLSENLDPVAGLHTGQALRRDDGGALNSNPQRNDESGTCLLSSDVPPSSMVHSNNVSIMYLLFLACIIVLLGTFLVHQGYLFFCTIEDNYVSALSSAVVAELLPFAAAVMLGVGQRKAFKLLLTLILLGCISGLACFMYASLSLRMDEQSQTGKQARIERTVLEQSLSALGESLNALPSSHVSKRQALVAQMSSLEKELRMSAAPVYETWHSTNASIQLAFSVWLRVAAMLVNAIFVHHLVSCMSLRSRA